MKCKCKYCGTEFERIKSQVRYKETFCSRRCNIKYYKPTTYKKHLDKIIIEELKGGWNGCEIASRHGLNTKTVYNHIKKLMSSS